MEAKSTLSAEDLQDLRRRGNRCFGDEDWHGAIRLYSQCIQSLQSLSISLPPEQSGEQDLVTSYSNRAEAWLKLNNFEKALADCHAALEIDPGHLKSLYRKGRALHALQQYEDAISALQAALQQSPDSSEIRRCLEKSSRFDSQSRTGKYDISKYLLSGRKEGIPEVGDYVGDVVIQRTADGRGRGLFAARNINPGELLLVSNAFAIAHGGLYGSATLQMKSDLERNLLAMTLDRAMASRQAMLRLQSLAGSSNQDAMAVPPMDLFRPNKSLLSAGQQDGEASDPMQIDAERVASILRFNPFGGSMKDVYFSGLWILPSFFNHSCLPNCSTLYVGEAMFVHATRNIGEGEEITTYYFDLLTPYDERARWCRKLEFACGCQRCELERSLPMAMQQRIARKYEGLSGLGKGDAKFVAELEREMKSPELRLSSEEKRWIRAAYAKIYLRAFPSGDFSEEENLAQSLQCTAPGNPTFLLVASRFAEKVKRNSKLKKMGLQMAREACIAAIGNQEERVLQAFIRDPMSVFPFFF